MSKQLFKKAGPPILAVLALLLVWEVYVKVYQVEAWLLPAPTAIMREALNSSPRLWMHTVATLEIAIIGFILGTVVGLVLSVVLHTVFPPLRQAFYPLIILSQNIPIIALAPLLVVWFGFGILPKVLIIALMCFFPILIAALQGLDYPDPAMLDYLRMIGAKRSQIFYMLELPNSLPHLFSGLKVSATYSMMGAVISEWLGAQKGLGVYMRLSAASFRTDRVFVSIVIIVALSLLFFAFISFLEKRLIRWNLRREGA
ncbi:MAG TPA: nitrate ABC transporter permease [Firmicutes bacterium]|nr:nitrate ABC transporter permease [Bacillota bacterium]